MKKMLNIFVYVCVCGLPLYFLDLDLCSMLERSQIWGHRLWHSCSYE